VQERLLSSPSKTQAEIENEVFDELMYEEDNPKRPVGFGFNVDRSDVFGVNGVLRKRGCTFHDNDIELKRVKEELASQKSMFLLILKAMRNGQITNDVLDATEAALRRAGGDQVSLLFFFSQFIKRNKDQCRLPPKYEKEERCIQWYLLQTDSVSNG